MQKTTLSDDVPCVTFILEAGGLREGPCLMQINFFFLKFYGRTCSMSA